MPYWFPEFDGPSAQFLSARSRQNPVTVRVRHYKNRTRPTKTTKPAGNPQFLANSITRGGYKNFKSVIGVQIRHGALSQLHA
jgi:hypothetical protein